MSEESFTYFGDLEVLVQVDTGDSAIQAHVYVSGWAPAQGWGEAFFLVIAAPAGVILATGQDWSPIASEGGPDKVFPPFQVNPLPTPPPPLPPLNRESQFTITTGSECFATVCPNLYNSQWRLYECANGLSTGAVPLVVGEAQGWLHQGDQTDPVLSFGDFDLSDYGRPWIPGRNICIEGEMVVH